MWRTSSMGLVLGGKQPVTLTGFSDSSWADDAESLRSTQGYCFSPGTGAVSWRLTRASSVSSSSCEAKVYPAAMAPQELCWLSFLLIGLGERPRSPQVLFTDNRSAILLWEELRLVGKAKHIQIRYFLLRELQQRGQALVRRVVSEANTAYIFTKALPPCDHERFCTKLAATPTAATAAASAATATIAAAAAFTTAARAVAAAFVVTAATATTLTAATTAAAAGAASTATAAAIAAFAASIATAAATASADVPAVPPCHCSCCRHCCNSRRCCCHYSRRYCYSYCRQYRYNCRFRYIRHCCSSSCY
ncbi:unnamed protein product [Closterium sp. NIES-53]